MHGDGVELDLVALVARIQVDDRTERRDARVVAQDRDLPLGQFGDERGPTVAVGQVDGADLDLHAVLLAQLGGELLHDVAAAGDQNQRVSARGQFGGEGLADAGGGAGHDRAGVRGGIRQAHDSAA